MAARRFQKSVRRPSRRSTDISRVRFHRYNESTLSVAGNLSFAVSPATSQLGALTSMSAQFDLYRVINLEYRLHPVNTAVADSQGIAYFPDGDVQFPASVSVLSESPDCTEITVFTGVPTQWRKVPRVRLKGQLDWYKCTPDAGAVEFETQGFLLLKGGVSDGIAWEVRGVIEFKNPLATAIMLNRFLSLSISRGLALPLPSSSPPEPTVREVSKAAPTLPDDSVHGALGKTNVRAVTKSGLR